MGMDTLQYDIFLSYHWRDHATVEPIAQALRTRNLEVFLDRWYLSLGKQWINELERILSNCKSVAIFIGPDGLGSWQLREQQLALTRQAEDLSFPVIPVLLPGSESPLGFLRLNTWIDLKNGINDLAIDALVAAVHGETLGAKEQNFVQAAKGGICPFRGLLPFREEDADFFFGRDAFTNRLE